ncbi:PA2779 family protein [Geoalkalibacter sp.]|uniref:PA2779 family protein n=1 Tax=Geoalkalibacter sp. TaxID=3041440 RepID=UPI00272E7868|nr:PA2779 family protein [Geoalkalibacter sp.]
MSRKRIWILDSRICWVVLMAFTLLSLVPNNSFAGLMDSRLSTGESYTQRADDLDKIRQALQQEVVAQRLADYGFSSDEIAAKLPTLSDEQIHQIAGLTDSLGEGADGLGLVIAVLVIVLLVVLILKLSDKQIIIK